MADGSNAYATVEDLEARYRALTGEEAEKAQTLLNDAAVKLRMEFKHYGVKLEPDEDTLETLKQVSCAMVKRVMASPGFEEALGADIREFRTDVGQLAETYGFANPDGSMFIKAEERRLLGLTKRGRISTVRIPCMCARC